MTGMTKEEGINQVFGGGGHVVILGAGASIAADKRNPEKNGKELPSMENLIEVIGLSDIFENLQNKNRTKNFETLYCLLYEENPTSPDIKEVEKRVYEYFGSMQLPDEPTIYDYLILSLRSKDLIATFNWDPFLYQAWCRNQKLGDQPYIAFLHGNVAIGYSEIDKRCGPADMYVKATGNYMEPTQLLFPITKKDYQDEFTQSQWEMLREWLSSEDTKRLTIFGYSAPQSDLEAINLMKSAWKQVGQREMEQIEVIDKQPEEVILKSWEEFTYGGHTDYSDNYFGSVLAYNPRRTSESYFNHYLPMTPSEAFRQSNQIPQDFKTLEELWDWHKPLIEAEEKWKNQRENEKNES